MERDEDINRQSETDGDPPSGRLAWSGEGWQPARVPAARERGRRSHAPALDDGEDQDDDTEIGDRPEHDVHPCRRSGEREAERQQVRDGVESPQPERRERQVDEQHAGRTLPEERQDPGADEDRLIGREPIGDLRGIAHRRELLERDLVGGKIGLVAPRLHFGRQAGAQVVGGLGAPLPGQAPHDLVHVPLDPLVPLDDHRFPLAGVVARN